MTKDDDRIRDKRSTGRKRGRRVLIELCERGERSYTCAECGHVPSKSYKDSSRSGDFLDCNHKNKNWLDNDPDNLEWVCRKCHYAKDRATDKGVASDEYKDEYGYGSLDLY